MWKTVISHLPEWEIYLQSFAVLIVPLGISAFFRKIGPSKDGSPK
ncbi:hypothetical protein KIS4809_3783 [Bacillus sp. ZZV12-4809]|nr:hypothetical protein KIS4809_3783 [Bacillus sp. ZZV12-4809]